MRKIPKFQIELVHELMPIPRTMDRFPILLTNDDGVNSPGLLKLASALNGLGHPIMVIAPLNEQSASGMKLTLREGMRFQEHKELAKSITINEESAVRIFSLDGTPCDCVIVALDGGLNKLVPDISPSLCISGINRGPNLSVDIFHSGTVSAAREASLYGLPAISVSLATYSHQNYSDSISCTLQIIEAISSFLPTKPQNLLRPKGAEMNSPNNRLTEVQNAFLSGDIFLNVNVPEVWNGGIETVKLGARWYQNASDMMSDDSNEVTFHVGAATIIEEDIENTDCVSVKNGFTSITPLASWPQLHPLGVSNELLEISLESNSKTGLPTWLYI